MNFLNTNTMYKASTKIQKTDSVIHYTSKMVLRYIIVSKIMVIFVEFGVLCLLVAFHQEGSATNRAVLFSF